MAEYDVPPAADHVVLDLRAVEDYIRDSKLALVNAVAYVVLVGVYAVMRFVLDVPYLRAAIGLYLALAIAAVVVKRVLTGRRDLTLRFSAAALAGLGASVLVLVGLVQLNRGTVFAEVAAGLVGFTVTHVLDRIAVARA
ncbi:hypothetical protein ABLE68_09880 [Nocardioides sp. CN2-186]|uniref:hypothetical protein n=1 Tax=Nocardioides tweenelious TaxID=3156607 RepID=UPI0032B36153